MSLNGSICDFGFCNSGSQFFPETSHTAALMKAFSNILQWALLRPLVPLC